MGLGRVTVTHPTFKQRNKRRAGKSYELNTNETLVGMKVESKTKKWRSCLQDVGSRRLRPTDKSHRFVQFNGSNIDEVMVGSAAADGHLFCFVQNIDAVAANDRTSDGSSF